jgi:hypothetical protein
MYDKKKIKAVRVMLGFTDDLRIDLPLSARRSVVKIVEENEYTLLGHDAYFSDFKEHYIYGFVSRVMKWGD